MRKPRRLPVILNTVRITVGLLVESPTDSLFIGGITMHLSRTYPWRLDLSERELNIVERALDIVVSEGDLDEESHMLADHLLFNIRNIHNKTNTHRKPLIKNAADTQMHEVVVASYTSENSGT